MFKKILFCTDFSENSHFAFRYALGFSKAFKSRLLILHVTAEPIDLYRPSDQLERVVKANQKKVIDQELKTHYLNEMRGFKNYKIILKEGVAFDEIIKTAQKESVNLIVMGTHGRTGLDYILIGSTAERVVRKSPVPVLTVKLPGKKFVMP